MSKETFGYIPEAKDLDRIATQRRLIPYETYIEMISRMDPREQILAKLFYLGGPRALEEVISLKIEDIDFTRSLIHFPEAVSYPRHLLEDIKNYVECRKKGFVFMGRDGDRISHTTPFRALKTVVTELKLDPEFTFKDLTRNI
jgi:integrase